MKCYRVYGEHGPLAHQYIERIIYAQTEQNARILFENYVRRHALYLWDYICQRNVYVEERK